MIDVVVSRYKDGPDPRDNTNWLGFFKKLYGDECRVLVYNKGPELPPSDVFTEIRLPNVGYEANSYFTHILRNWEHLASRTFFIHAYAAKNCGPIQDIVPLITNDFEYYPLSTNFLVCNKDGRRPGIKNEQVDLQEMWDVLFDKPMPEQVHFWAGSQFMLSRSKIMETDRKKWQSLLEKCTKKQHTWAMERLWHSYFAKNPTRRGDLFGGSE